MIEHWPSILSAVCAIVVVVAVKYTFVTQKECTRIRKQCQEGMCRKITSVKDSSNEKTDVLTLGARDAVQIFNDIRAQLAGVREDISGLRASFEQYLKDIAN